MEIVEIIGYVGSFLIALSLTMKNIVKLRWINLFGASTFAIYGFIIGTYPVLILNSFIAITDVVYLVNMYRKKDFFSTLNVRNDARYLLKFLQFYKEDIEKFFPDFSQDNLEDSNCFFILRNMRPVGLFIYKKNSDTEIEVCLDFAIPDFRDLKNANYIYSTDSIYLKEKGYKRIVTSSKTKAHQLYLKKVGFTQSDNDQFIKEI